MEDHTFVCNYSEDYHIATCSGGIVGIVSASPSGEILQAESQTARVMIFEVSIIIFLVCILIALNTFKR